MFLKAFLNWKDSNEIYNIRINFYRNNINFFTIRHENFKKGLLKKKLECPIFFLEEIYPCTKSFRVPKMIFWYINGLKVNGLTRKKFFCRSNLDELMKWMKILENYAFKIREFQCKISR